MTEVEIRTWMYISAVAKRLRQSELTIRRYINEGKLVGGNPDRESHYGIQVLGAPVVEFEK